MSEAVWISGWASDVSVWENEIYERFPGHSHRFIDYFDLLPEPDDFWDNNPRIGEAGLVVGWSMGTLALLRNLHKKPSEQKWLLICPVADFCVDGCWSLAAVKAMKRGVLENTEQTLMAFSALMGETSKEKRERWLGNALKYSPKQLAQGLDYLMQKKAECNSALNVEFIFGEKDKVVPLAQKELFPSARVCENQGHWIDEFFDTI
ncbi:MAG: hypothetical protein LBC85_04440 [Fibromonadaceae bacterium]|jgi:pimeloyl-ACP methyl ester carboxylesterase|nr:hypothetical protein [Fibromonadaceae bacterium]